MKTKNIRVLSFVLCFVLLLASCNFSDNGDPETPENKEPITVDIAGYAVIRSDKADEETVNAVTKLYKELRKLDKSVDFTTDYVGKNESVPTDTKEVLVGATNRAESKGIRYLDYEIAFVNNRIVVNGGCGIAVANAVDWFIENCIKDGAVTIPGGGYTYNASYPNENLTVDGIALKDFALEITDSPDDKALQKWLGEHVGILSASNHVIRFTQDKKLGANEISMKLSGEDILLSCSPYLANDHGLLINRFLETLKNAKNPVISLKGKETIEMNQIKSINQTGFNQLRAETDECIEDILDTPNMSIPAGAKVYYVSPNGKDSNAGTSASAPWKTVDKVNSASLGFGSYVCFQRGGVWRGTMLKAQAGVTYTAYGSGEKPKLYGSPENGANPAKWVEVSPNIWYYQGSENMKDVGALVFNDGDAVSEKVTLYVEKDYATGKVSVYNCGTYSGSNKEVFERYTDLCRDLQMYHDRSCKVVLTNKATGATENYNYTGSGKLYLYSTKNPGERFDSIEFNIGINGIDAGVDNVTVDNLCVMYFGIHGVGAAGTPAPCKNLKVQNCEFGWIGGSAQSDSMGRNYQTRLGNAVEIYGGCDGFTVKNNYIYQIYDTGITVQANYYNVSSSLRDHLYMKNVSYLNNVIENCEMAFEIWMSDIKASDPSRMENYLVEGNKIWYTGYGFCEQRPVIDQSWNAAIKNRCSATGNRAYNYVIKDNLIAMWKYRAVQCTSNLFNPDGSDSLPLFSGNVYVERYGKKIGQVEVVSTDFSHTDAIFDFDVVGYMTEHKDTDRGTYLTKDHTDGTDEFWFYS